MTEIEARKQIAVLRGSIDAINDVLLLQRPHLKSNQRTDLFRQIKRCQKAIHNCKGFIQGANISENYINQETKEN